MFGADSERSIALATTGGSVDLILDLAVETLEDHDIDSQHIDNIAAQLKSYRPSVVIAKDSDE